MSNYWERRAVWDLYKNLDDAEATADLIAKSVQKCFYESDLRCERYI